MTYGLTDASTYAETALTVVVLANRTPADYLVDTQGHVMPGLIC